MCDVTCPFCEHIYGNETIKSRGA